MKGTSVFGTYRRFYIVRQPTPHHRQSNEYDDLEDIGEEGDVDGSKGLDFATKTSSEVNYY